MLNMMPNTARWIDFASAFEDLVADQAKWSQDTFGPDRERGPLGPLAHLGKESIEAMTVWNEIPAADTKNSERMKRYRTELADCFLLILDAARRSGMTPLELVKEAQAKMEINKTREWPKAEPDKPVEHIR